ncbi:NAD-dependent epimerase/dehydratase family protein [Tautonia rosea]|uniref:NAD-dependent epimerase/dehydratase family protein n=1 Tax=Tautonia rosea TaxID=2728037 RepID=UPI001F2F616E|nr:NAD-dependent epimerase/dehydratase family protein [Tautonia rosea]
MSTWLVTGGSGFLGHHLLNRMVCSDLGITRLIALGRRPPEGWPADAFLRADLNDPASLSRALATVRPRVVLHLAGLTPPADEATLHRVNAGGTLALLRALQAIGRPCRIVSAGSAAELGPVPEALLPANETIPCRPDSPYGLSKWFASQATVASPRPIEGIAARIFNPIGPGMPSSQAFGRFAAQLAAPSPDPLSLQTGNLDARRDLIDARDVADALIALALRGHPGRVYHVGTGSSHRIGDGLHRLIALSGRRVVVSSDPNPGPGPVDSRACIAAIRRDTGWSPRIPIDESLADLWNSVRPRSLRPDAPHPPPSPNHRSESTPIACHPSTD